MKSRFSLARRPITAIGAPRRSNPLVASLRKKLEEKGVTLANARKRASENKIDGVKCLGAGGLAAIGGGLAGVVDAFIENDMISMAARGLGGLALVGAGGFLVGGTAGGAIACGGAGMLSTVTYDLAKSFLAGGEG